MIYFFYLISVRGTPPARRERGELSFAPAPVLQAAGDGLSNNRWSLFGLTPSATVRRLPPLGRIGSARPVIPQDKKTLDTTLKLGYSLG